MRTSDLRGYTRIEIDAPCVIDGKVAGQVRNLSLGGALVRCAGLDADLYDAMTIEIAHPEQPVKLAGEVVRVSESTHDQQVEYAIRLTELEPGPFARYFKYVDQLLAGKGGGLRIAPRLHRRIELHCRTNTAFHATMQNVSRGGLGLQCTVPVEAGQAIAIEVFRDRLDPEVELAGVVTHVESTEGGPSQVGVRFTELAPDQLRRLEQLLQSLLRGW